MTTPCYDFNQLFTPPEDLSSQVPPHGNSPIHASYPPIVREGGFLDPTGRTTRVFRHSDHKFEWTHDEFKNWCISQAEQWGYDVQYGGIGRAIDPDPWGRDFSPSGEPLRATFTAIFRRRDDRHQPPTTLLNSVTTTSHQLILDIEHPAHSSSNKPLSLDDIRGAMQECILDRCDGNSIEVYDLWGNDALAVACGGSLETLFASVDTLVCKTSDWEWDGAGRSRWRRRIVWNGYTERQRELPKEMGISPVEEDTSQEEVGVFSEESSWNNQEGGDQSVWETGVDNNSPGLTLDDQEASPGGGAWNRDADGWGSPQRVQTELDDWGDWDEKQLGELKRDASVW
jgi:hypothetical protein